MSAVGELLETVDRTSDELVATLKEKGEETARKTMGEDMGDVSRAVLGAGKKAYDAVKSVRGVTKPRVTNKTVQEAAKGVANSFIEGKDEHNKMGEPKRWKQECRDQTLEDKSERQKLLEKRE